MKITLETLANSFQSIKKLSSFDLGDPKTNFKFMGIVDEVEKAVEKYNKLRTDIFKKYGSKNGHNSYAIPIEKQDVFYKDLEAAGVIEIELEWDIIDCQLETLKSFTANDMKSLNGKFINIKGE